MLFPRLPWRPRLYCNQAQPSLFLGKTSAPGRLTCPLVFLPVGEQKGAGAELGTARVACGVSPASLLLPGTLVGMPVPRWPATVEDVC